MTQRNNNRRCDGVLYSCWSQIPVGQLLDRVHCEGHPITSLITRSQNWQGWEQWSVTLDVFSLACSLRFAFNEGNGADVVMVSALDSFGQPSGATGRNAEKVTPVFTPYQLTQDTSGGAERGQTRVYVPAGGRVIVLSDCRKTWPANVIKFRDFH